MTETILSVLAAKNQEKLDILTNSLVTGSAKDYAAYTYMCGQIRGLKVAQNSIEDLAKAQMEDDDEE